MHRTIACSLAIASLVLLSVHAPAQEPARKPPNVLLILIDDLGWTDLHCQGNERLQTPHIDRLAKQGVRFTDAYAASPVCSPVRAAIMTGMAPSTPGTRAPRV